MPPCEEAESVTNSTVYGLFYFRSSPDDDPKYRLALAHQLDADEYDSLLLLLDELRHACDQPMVGLLEDALELFRNGVASFMTAWKPEPDDVARDDLSRLAKTAAFAATSAVYGFQEQAEAQARRLGGDELRTRVHAVFKEAYERDRHYFLALRLRQLFTHSGFVALSTRTTSRLNAAGHTTCAFSCAVVRQKVLPEVSGAIKMWLAGLDEDPSLEETLARAADGMREVNNLLRPLLTPNASLLVQKLLPYRTSIMNPAFPLVLGRTTYGPEGQPGPVTLKQINQSELALAGLVQLTDAEIATSTTLAIGLIEGDSPAP